MDYVKKILILSLSLTPLALVNCAHVDAEKCAQLDWFELGRQDGASGAKIQKIETRIGICEADQQKAMSALYYHGRSAGLSEYCLSENAFELGTTGLGYDHVCPLESQDLFISSYQRGREVLELEKTNFQLKVRIKKLQSQLERKALEPKTRQSLLTLLDALSADAKDNKKRISLLTGKQNQVTTEKKSKEF